MRALAGCLLAALLTACSSPADPEGPPSTGSPRPTSGPTSGATAADDPDVVRDGLTGLFAGPDPRPAEVRKGRCVAARLVTSATPEQLRGGGLVGDDGEVTRRLPTLPEDLARLTAEAQLACVDVVAASTRALTSVQRGDLDPEAYADCLVDAVPREAQRAALVATLAGRYDDAAVARLAEAQVGCAEAQE